jgi:bifunctional UDP-N-acetylglucosamine pyrophosphorylase/glucosamine-1-phosphate N-acetyltransferase
VKLACVVLAAGLGKRMYSSLPKVLHPIQGTPMLRYVLGTVHELDPQRIIVVIGKHGKDVKESIQGDINACPTNCNFSFAYQKEAKGTAHALMQALPFMKGFKGTVLVINGDTPLISLKILKKIISLHKQRKDIVSFLTFQTHKPQSYGRIIRDREGHVLSIIEDRDATASQKKIKEVNSGVYVLATEALPLLKEIKMNVSKGEYYLTDIIHIARGKGEKTNAYCIGSEDECAGVNTREDLEKVRRFMKEKIINKWVQRGVNFIDTSSVFLSPEISIGRGTTVYPNVHLEGKTKIGKHCTVFPNVRILNCTIEDSAIIKDCTLIEDSVVKKRATVGPFAHVRPGSVIGPDSRIGNFVEVKKSVVGSGTKAGHLTYLGDAQIGKNVNIGAGTITCNYDGYRKHTTVIKDNVFVGSDSQLIAPVEVGEGAYIGAGSTITKDVASKALALSRVEQRQIHGWALKRTSKEKRLKQKRKRKASGVKSNQ